MYGTAVIGVGPEGFEPPAASTVIAQQLTNFEVPEKAARAAPSSDPRELRTARRIRQQLKLALAEHPAMPVEWRLRMIALLDALPDETRSDAGQEPLRAILAAGPRKKARSGEVNAGIRRHA